MHPIRSILVAAFLVCPSLHAADYGPVGVREIPLAENRADGTVHGYVEYRFRVTNRDKRSHQVTLSMPYRPYSVNEPSLHRSTGTTEVPPESTVVMKLLQPPLVMYGPGEVRVAIDGRDREEPTTFHKFDAHMRAYPVHANEIAHVLVGQAVSPELRDLIRTKYVGPADTSPHPPGTAPTPDVIPWLAGVPVEEWSDSWLAYTRFDAVLLTDGEWRELQSRRPAVLDALRRYVEAGGMLALAGADWTPPKNWVVDPRTERDYQAVFGTACLLPRDPDVAKPWINDLREKVFAQARPWRQAMDDLGGVRFGRMHDGTGSLLSGNTPLLQSLPVLDDYSVSVRLVMVLIIVFALLIGPVNMYLLYLLNRRIWLLWTVPLTSFLAGAAVLGVSVFQEGLLRQSSSWSLTVLDQRREEATTIGLAGFYSTLSPGGLQFSADTEVTPCINRGGRGGDNRAVELSLYGGNQHLTRGWVAARIPAYFLLRKAETQRKERIAFDWQASPPTATNGFGADIKRLLVRSPDGMLYRAEKFSAGAKVELAPAPDPTARPNRFVCLRNLRTTGTQLLESGSPLPSIYDPNTLAAGSYQAELDVRNPFLEPGLERARPFRDTTAIYGIFE